ncbi:disks large-associated protein 1 isoform X2 [Alosa sapidissima]|uniref:disks large-associated protein 1 isoform X2 n=1 Tax=Alosa sapidissima TaxID=34773 RepID=UPI001C0A3F3E|nr:disks large-associated protein 1 isoform X2 [Alosa sapidissima]
MKGLSSSRSHHHVMACEPSYDVMGYHAERSKPYLISQVDAPHPADHPYYAQRSVTSSPYQPDCVVPYGTFPRRHYSSHHELKDECALVPYTGGGGSGSGSVKGNRLPVNLLDQFERQLPAVASRDGYHTLQYKRTAALEQRSDSPGRIRHLVHSVQKLFTKSHSLEGPHQVHHHHAKGSVNGAGGGGSCKVSPDSETPTLRQRKRSKSRERCKSAEPKNRSSPHVPASGYWSSDDNLERDVCLYRSPTVPTAGVMTMGRHPDKSQSQYFLEAYNTISEHTLKTSRSNNDVGKCSTCAIGGGGGIAGPLAVEAAQQLVKKSSWSSSLTVSRAREVYQKASVVNVDKALVKAEACQQERSCQYLQVPQDDWGGGFTPLAKEDDIPCRRMRSGSYVKAMAEDDSGDSDGSPKPSPKMQARRASYLKATQPSLTEMTTLKISTEHSPKLQIRSHSYLRAVSEVSINRSLDSLDPKALLASPQYRSRNESYMRAMSTISQVSEVEVNGQIEAVCESVFSEMESQAVDALDLPVPGCFRMRSHSYVRAIDQGCSQDDEVGPLLPASPPRTTTTVRTIQSSTVSSCITTYKKTPPPVPPRTSTKPFISITAQSSTESAQDAYMEGSVGPRGVGGGSGEGRALHSGLSNSTESIDSMKALTAAIEAANAQIHGPASQHVSSSSAIAMALSLASSSACTSASPSPAPSMAIAATAIPALTMGSDTGPSIMVSSLPQLLPSAEEARREALRKSRCLSIGIQVDGPEDTPDSEDPSKFQSVGIQVEEERAYRRFTRSNSVTTAVQADLDTHELSESPGESPDAELPDATASASASASGSSTPGILSRQYSRDAATSTVSIQGSGNHYHACTSDDYEDVVGFDPSILPPPDPWIDSVTDDPLEVVGRSVCQRDGHWFLKLLQAETERMEGWCRQMEQDEQENELPDDILGKIRSAVGSAQLLMSQKFQQFRELCEENLNPNAHPRPVSQDLAGFWDMLQLSIENISLKFDELHQLKANNWRPLDPPERKERKLPPPVPKKPPKGHPPLARDRSLESTEKQRQEARKRLMAAKRAASVRQNSATESADSIEIYIPEAQTRL